jgi:hypothetical protein
MDRERVGEEREIDRVKLKRGMGGGGGANGGWERGMEEGICTGAGALPNIRT